MFYFHHENMGKMKPFWQAYFWIGWQKKTPPSYPVKLSPVAHTAGWVGRDVPEEVQDVTTRTGSLGTRISPLWMGNWPAKCQRWPGFLPKFSGGLVVLEIHLRLAIGIIFLGYTPAQSKQNGVWIWGISLSNELCLLSGQILWWISMNGYGYRKRLD